MLGYLLRPLYGEKVAEGRMRGSLNFPGEALPLIPCWTFSPQTGRRMLIPRRLHPPSLDRLFQPADFHFRHG
jgi:hypothetical protein